MMRKSEKLLLNPNERARWTTTTRGRDGDRERVTQSFSAYTRRRFRPRRESASSSGALARLRDIVLPGRRVSRAPDSSASLPFHYNSSLSAASSGAAPSSPPAPPSGPAPPAPSP